MTDTTLHAGAYRSNITGPLGIAIEADYTEKRATDILDELYANALVLDDGQTEVALVSVDVCSINAEIVRAVAAQVEARCGLSADNILITATHTHGAPAVNEEVLELYQISREYVHYFTQQIVTAICLAHRRKQPARLGVGRGEHGDYTFNRRLRLPNGTVIMNWFDKTLLREAEPLAGVDPELLVLKLASEASGELIALLVNYTNHNNAAPGGAITSDFAGVMSDELRRIYGEQLVVLFTPGAAGDINWIDHRDFDQRSPALYRRIGRSLAGAVLTIEAKMRYSNNTELALTHKTLSIAERPLREFDWRDEPTYPKDENGQPSFMGTYTLPNDRREIGQVEQPVHEVAVCALAIGDEIGLVTNPTEYFVDFGLDIKARSPFAYTLVCELTNGWAGYVPTQKALHEGGYESRKIPNNSHLALDAGDQIAEASVELLHALHERHLS